MPKFRIAKEKEKQEDTIKRGDILILTEKSRGSRKEGPRFVYTLTKLRYRTIYKMSIINNFRII